MNVERGGRGVIEVAGPEARALLQRLITNDVDALSPGEARYAGLLTPQGKIVVDFLVVSVPTPDAPERFLLDCPAALAADLARKLTLYKLRAKVTIADLSATWTAVPLPEEIAPGDTSVMIFVDPRSDALGFRAIGPRDALTTLLPDPAEVDARRIRAGVPEGGLDFIYGDAFPHEANFDRLGGVDFRKGCYVGQEVVSRMQHRGTARKRVLAVQFDTAPATGTVILAGDVPVGTMGSAAGFHGLAMMRTDRVAEAETAGVPLVAEGISLRVISASQDAGAGSR